jgi:hypothetical protein
MQGFTNFLALRLSKRANGRIFHLNVNYIDGHITSFSCISFLKYSVGHDESIIFVAWNEKIGNWLKFHVNTISLFGFIVEKWSILND